MDTEIEVFRADTRASRGITAEHIADVASFDCAANPVGICFGHPKSDDPAAGTIAGFRAEGGKLFAKIASLTDSAIAGIKSGEWLNRSMAFFHPDDEANPTPGKFAPRHLGLLGASAPGIPGMAPLKASLAFAADGETLLVDGPPADAWCEAPTPTPIIFTAKERADMPTEKTPEQIAAEQEFAAREDKIAEREKAAALRIQTAFNASNNTAIDALVTQGKVTPAEAVDLKVAFAALDPEGAELTFGAGEGATKATAAGKLLAFMAGLPKRVPLGDSLSPKGEFDADAIKTPADMTAQAKKLAEEKGMTFDAAYEQIAEAAEQAA